MIVVDSQDPQDVKDSPLPVFGPAIRRPDRILGSASSVVLPDYETSQAIELEARHLLRSTSTLSSSSSPSLAYRRKRITLKEWLPSRFWRILFYLMIGYVVLTLVVGVPVIVLKVVKQRASFTSQLPPPAVSWLDDAPHDAPLWFENGVLVFSNNSSCDRWTTKDILVSDDLFLSQTSYALPASGSIAARLTTILSKTPSELISGNFDVEINPDPKETRALFNLTLHTSNLELRRSTHVCFQDTGPDRGLIIYAPTNITDITDVNINIWLSLPQSYSTNQVKSLATYLPGLDQTFAKLDSYFFDQVNAEGAHSSMIFTSIHADKLFIRNSLAPITGTFNTTNSLNIDNISGPVLANVTLMHNSDREAATYLSIDNGNADIRARVTLSAPRRRTILPGPKPSFTGIIKTFDEPILLDIIYDPSTPVAPLNFAVQNNLGDANITVDAKYEGTFDAVTKLAKTSIIQTRVEPSYDPTGLGRSFRHIFDYKSTNRAFGWVGWSGRTKSSEDVQSNIVVTSAMNPVSLRFHEVGTQSITRTRR